MFDILYEQTYTMKWKYLAALLDMFNPQIGQLPNDDLVDELIDAEYVVYDREKKEFHLSPNYQILINSFLNTRTAVNIEAPRVTDMHSTLSLYYLNNHRHMLVLIHTDNNDVDGFVEIAISSKTSSATKLLEHIGSDLGVSIYNPKEKRAESFDADKLPNEYKECYEEALTNNRLFRVTLYEQNDDGSDGSLAVFAAFPSKDNLVWITAMRQRFNKKEKPILIQKLPSEEYKQQLTLFFDLFEKQLWE